MAKVTLKILLRRQGNYETDKVLREACKISKVEAEMESQKILPPGL